MKNINKKELYIYHHLGLGDHIICNAIVRNYSKLYDKIYIFAKSHNYESVKFMFRDLNNIVYIMGDDSVAEQTIINKDNVLKIGFDKLDRNIKFDKSFYNQINLDFNKRWDNFYVERDMKREKELFNKLKLKENQYIFVHDDINRRFEINEKYIKNKLPIFRPNKKYTDNIFDYLYIIENSNEIHCMDSSFKLIIDSLKTVKTDNLYYHIYVRGNGKTSISNSKLNWKKII